MEYFPTEKGNKTTVTICKTQLNKILHQHADGQEENRSIFSPSRVRACQSPLSAYHVPAYRQAQGSAAFPSQATIYQEEGSEWVAQRDCT